MHLFVFGVWLQAARLIEAELRADMPDIGSVPGYRDAAGL